MVWWISLAVVVIALIGLGAMLLELRAKMIRLDKAVKLAQQRTEPGIKAVRLITEIPKPSFDRAKPTMTLIGAAGDTTGVDPAT